MGRTKEGKKTAKKEKAPPPKPVEPESDSDEEESSEEEVQVPQPKKKTPAKKAPAKAEPESDSDEDDSDEDESEEEDMDTAITSAIAKKKSVNGKAAAAAADSDDDDDDDDESESDEDEAPAKAAPKKAKQEDSDDDDEDDDDEEESDDDDDSEEETTPKKRKAKDTKKQEPPAKKTKVDNSDPDARTIFVKNLTQKANEKKLKKVFPGLESVRIPTKPEGGNKGFAFMTFSTVEESEDALKNKQGTELDGEELYLDTCGKNKKKDGAQQRGGGGNFDESKAKTLFVKNLPEGVSKEDLEAHFEGTDSITLPLDNYGSTKGFAFLEYSTSEAVTSALEEKQGSDLGGNALFLDRPKPKRDSFGGGQRGGGGFQQRGERTQNSGEAGKTKVLFVRNLPYDLSKEELAGAFDNSTEARIAIFPDTQKPRGFGYVEFSNAADAKAAYDSSSGLEIKGRNLTVDFALERSDSGRGGGRGGGRGFGDRGGRGRGGFGDRGRGGRGGFGDRGRGGRGRGGDRGRGGRGGRGGFQDYQGKKKSFNDDSD